MKLKVITFDFWNTIYDSTNGVNRNSARQRAIINEIDKYDRLIKQDEFEEAMKASWEYFNNIWTKEHKTPSPKDTVTFFWKYLKLPDDSEAIANVVNKFENSILDSPPSLNEGVFEAIEALSNDFDLAIISDTGFSPGSVLRQLLKKDELFHFFKSFSFSDETGVSKPHKDAYFKVLNDLSCSPDNALHIGDIERTDIVGAKNIGMLSIRFSGDKTATIAKENPLISKANAEIDNWGEIVRYIYDLNKI